ncbi:hypothetical protein EVAR_9751_1 [Eumeta japonica]|uniref:Uncharacterized protein n=1 Tax=Eumeta variegata TaxID=151549 RepID=A0A4C1U6V2_EUMVA|nr:hypothetical protein EVAR_9751_1 [Eumeta japonica]
MHFGHDRFSRSDDDAERLALEKHNGATYPAIFGLILIPVPARILLGLPSLVLTLGPVWPLLILMLLAIAALGRG